jgi:hypothetical protein
MPITVNTRTFSPEVVTAASVLPCRHSADVKRYSPSPRCEVCALAL